MIPLKDNIPTARFPILTVLLIAANIVVFAWQLHFPTVTSPTRASASSVSPESDQSTLEYGAIPYRLTHPGKDCAVGVV